MSIGGSACTVRQLYNFIITWGREEEPFCSDLISALTQTTLIKGKADPRSVLKISYFIHQYSYIAIQPSQTSQLIYCYVNELRSPLDNIYIYPACSFSFQFVPSVWLLGSTSLRFALRASINIYLLVFFNRILDNYLQTRQNAIKL